MDDDVKDILIDDIDPEKGNIKRQLDDIVNRDKGATDTQYRQIRDRMTSTKSRDEIKYERYGHKYINVKGDNYRKVTRKGDVWTDSKGNTWIRDSKGRFKEVLED